MEPNGQATAAVDDAVLRATTRSMLRGERAVSLARGLFCLAIWIRSAVMWILIPAGDHVAARALIEYPALASAIVVSFWCLRVREEPRAVKRLVLGSITIDALVAFVSLVSNPLWPWPGYPGLADLPDTTALVLVAVAAGLRLSPSGAALGAVLNVLSYVALSVIDWFTWGRSHAGVAWFHYALVGIYVAGAGALAFATAMRVRQLVAAAARNAAQAERARQGLGVVLRDQHDVRSALAAARLNADQLARAVDPSRADALGGVAELANELRRNMAAAGALVDSLKASTVGEIAALASPTPVDVDAALAEVLALVQPRFPAVAIDSDTAGAPPALIREGGASLRRILFNLVLNACEGDGRSAARHVQVRARAAGEGRRVVVDVADDGPGFPASVLDAPVGQAGTTKASGSGLGLALAASLTHASGGVLRHANRAEGGARVTLELPAAP